MPTRTMTNALHAPGGPPPGWQPYLPPPYEAYESRREGRGPLVFTAVVQFLSTGVIGFLWLFVLLLLVGYKGIDPVSVVLVGAFAAVTVLHIALGVGILAARRWAMILSVCTNAPYIATTLALTLPLVIAHGAYGWE